MPLEQRIEARHQAYRLLSQIYAEGLSPDLLDFIRQIPELASALPENSDTLSDELAADHYEILETNIFPYASIFLDESGLIGGHIAEGVLQAYSEAGYVPHGLSSRAPDHISIQLAFLGWLSEGEAAAMQSESTVDVHRLRNIQAKFLHDHLLTWIVPLTYAIKQQGNQFFSTLADLTLEVVDDHFESLSDVILTSPSPFALPSPPDLLADEGTGLKDIGAYLLNIPYSGITLSRNDIRKIAAQHEIPCGFGPRQTLMNNLMNSAARFEHFDALLESFETLIGGWQSAYQMDREAAAINAIAAVWQSRADRSAELIGEMRVKLAAEK